MSSSRRDGVARQEGHFSTSVRLAADGMDSWNAERDRENAFGSANAGGPGEEKFGAPAIFHVAKGATRSLTRRSADGVPGTVQLLAPKLHVPPGTKGRDAGTHHRRKLRLIASCA